MPNSKRAARKALLGVMNDPNASPRDRLMATARYERLKYKPRGLPAKQAKEAKMQPEEVQQQPVEQQVDVMHDSGAFPSADTCRNAKGEFDGNLWRQRFDAWLTSDEA